MVLSHSGSVFFTVVTLSDVGIPMSSLDTLLKSLESGGFFFWTRSVGCDGRVVQALSGGANMFEPNLAWFDTLLGVVLLSDFLSSLTPWIVTVRIGRVGLFGGYAQCLTHGQNMVVVYARTCAQTNGRRLFALGWRVVPWPPDMVAGKLCAKTWPPDMGCIFLFRKMVA